MQTPPSQLPKHNRNHPNVVSTGLHLSFADQNLISHSSSSFFSLLPHDFTSQINQQREELDQFLQAQGEQLPRTLAEKRQRHYRALLGAAEESVGRRLREKEAEAQKRRVGGTRGAGERGGAGVGGQGQRPGRRRYTPSFSRP